MFGELTFVSNTFKKKLSLYSGLYFPDTISCFNSERCRTCLSE